MSPKYTRSRHFRFIDWKQHDYCWEVFAGTLGNRRFGTCA